MKEKILILFLVVILIFGFSQFVIKAEENLYDTVVFNEEETIEIVKKEGNLYIKGKHFADLLDMDYDVQKALETISLSSDDLNFRLMSGSIYIQINGNTKRINYPAKIIDGKGYIPVDSKMFNKLGLIAEYQERNREVHIFEPKFTVTEFNFQNMKVQIKMDDIPPYRIAGNENELIIEFQKTKIGNDFERFIGHRLYQFDIEQNNTLRLKLKSDIESVLPKYEGIYEENNSLS